MLLFKIRLDIDLKAASKFFSSKFACGSSVTGEEIVIQGDVKDDLFDVLPEKWNQVWLKVTLRAQLCSFSGSFVFQIDEDNIDDLGDLKR